MTVLIFLVAGFAMMFAVLGRRGVAIGLFALALAGSVVWLNHHMTDPLQIAL